MKLTVAPESSAALTADGTIRCLLDMRYPLPSRHSSAAIAFAHHFAEELALAIPAHLGPHPAVSPPISDTGRTATLSTQPVPSYTADGQLLAVLLNRNRLWACIDLFLHTCKHKVRRQVAETLSRPIHVIVIHESGDGYRIRRSPALDARVAQRYEIFREMDKGPQPYFADNLNPPLYIDGIRFEGSLEGLDADLMAPEKDEEEWEVEEVCGHRTADDGVLEVRVRWKSRRETWELYGDVAQSEREALEEYECVHGRVTGDAV
jgi:hypothetical protein